MSPSPLRCFSISPFIGVLIGSASVGAVCPAEFARLAIVETAKTVFYPWYGVGKTYLRTVEAPSGKMLVPFKVLYEDKARVGAFLVVSTVALPMADPSIRTFLMGQARDENGEQLLYVDFYNGNGRGIDFVPYANSGKLVARIRGLETKTIEGKSFEQVLAQLQELRKLGKIKSLRFIGHSAYVDEGRTGVGLTNDSIGIEDVRGRTEEINRLPKDLFAKDAEIHLLGCYVGTNKELMIEFQKKLLVEHGEGGIVSANIVPGPLGTDSNPVAAGVLDVFFINYIRPALTGLTDAAGARIEVGGPSGKR